MKHLKETLDGLVNDLADLADKIQDVATGVNLTAEELEDSPSSTQARAITPESMEVLVKHITDKVTDSLPTDAADVVDFSSAEFELSGNEISLESIDLHYGWENESSISEAIREALTDFFDVVEEEKLKSRTKKPAVRKRK